MAKSIDQLIFKNQSETKFEIGNLFKNEDVSTELHQMEYCPDLTPKKLLAELQILAEKRYGFKLENFDAVKTLG